MFKRYLKEAIIFILQLLMFYVYPPIALPIAISGMEIVLMIMLVTLVLSFVLGIISDNKMKFLSPNENPKDRIMLTDSITALFHSIAPSFFPIQYSIVPILGMLKNRPHPCAKPF